MVQFTLPKTDSGLLGGSGSDTKFKTELSQASRRILQNIWDFTGGGASECYAYVDIDKHNIDAFVVVGNFIANPLELHTIEGLGFPDDENRRNAFIQYFANDVFAFEQVFKSHKKMLPRRVWLGVEVESDRSHMSLDYSPSTTALPDIAEAIDRFRNDVASSAWPLPIWTIAYIERE